MQQFNNDKDNKETKAEKAKKKVKGKLKKAVTAKLGGLVAFVLLKLMPIILALAAGAVLFDFINDVYVAGPNTSKQIYSILDVEDMSETIEMRGDIVNGYYWDFTEEAEQKLQEVILSSYTREGMHNLPNDVEFLKKIIKAELANQLPNLGGTIPEGSSGFQGNIKIRRSTPNKNIGEMKNVGKGETSTVEKETVSYNGEMANSYIDELKKYSAGAIFKTKIETKLYKESESKIDSSKGTGHFEVMYNENNKEINLSKGQEVTYTGNYKTSDNPLSEVEKLTVYVEIEIKDKNLKGYVKASTLIFSEETDSVETAKVKVTSRAGTAVSDTKTIGDGSKTFIIAIAAGNNDTDDIGIRNGNLIEEELTIKVAEKVEEIFKEYTNVKVEQTGSTAKNTGGVKLEDRTKKARDVDPDLCIQIHFNSSSDGSKSGVEAVYKDGDGISEQLATILTKNIASTMGLEDLGSGTDKEKCGGSILNIENTATSGFPSVLTKGCFLDSKTDSAIMKADTGVEKYAQGIVNGVVEYLEADHTGYSSSEQEEEKVTDSIETVVRNLKYIDIEELEILVDEGDLAALEYFALDLENKVVTASWTKGEDGIILNLNSAYDLRTPLQNFIVPYEYLLDFMMNTDYAQFSSDLADVILDSEIVIAVQDNVSTTREIETVQNKTVASEAEYSTKWQNVSSSDIITENCYTSINVAYVDTWCVKAYNENSYSTYVLDMENQDKKIVDIMGKVTESTYNSMSDEVKIQQGTGFTGETDENGTRIIYSYEKYERTKTKTTTISNQYEQGDNKVDEKNNKFVSLYNSHRMSERVRTDYLFRVIENNEKTVNLLDLTKYLIYRATGTSYDEIYEYDFQGEFNNNSFSSATTGEFVGSSFEEKIWWALIDQGYSPEIVAGAMGCFYNESGFISNNLENTYNKKWGLTDEEYTEKVNNGTISFEEFIRIDDTKKDGYGLAQWTASSRKKGLYEFAKHLGVGIDDEDMQIKYLIAEINGSGEASAFAINPFMTRNGCSKSTWENATDVRTAARAFAFCFEGYASSNEIAKRQNSAEEIYKKYINAQRPSGGSESSSGLIGNMQLSEESAAKMQAMLTEAIRIANDDRYLYSQPKRMQEFYYDCSSLVYRLYKKFFGITTPASTAGYGTSYRVGAAGTVELQPGDVLWRRKGKSRTCYNIPRKWTICSCTWSPR